MAAIPDTFETSGWHVTAAGLRRGGVLGMNARNLLYIDRWNPRDRYPTVDDKVRTKTLAIAAGVPVPPLIAVVESQGALNGLHTLLAGHAEFVVKPAQGAQGNGVLVISGRDGDRYVRPDGTRLDRADLAYHCSGILAGLHSLGGRLDRVLVEERLHTSPAFDDLAVGGVPDLRVIVYRGVPAMAMVRLPTVASRGRANLHQGAVAAGLELGTGKTIGGLLDGRSVEKHPDTGVVLAGREIPRWNDVLTLAASLTDVFGLGYLGIDVVLDRDRGPVLLEANARPGLGIQLANGSGLIPRLEAIDAERVHERPLAERVAWSRAWSVSKTAGIP